MGSSCTAASALLPGSAIGESARSLTVKNIRPGFWNRRRTKKQYPELKNNTRSFTQLRKDLYDLILNGQNEENDLKAIRIILSKFTDSDSPIDEYIIGTDLNSEKIYLKPVYAAIIARKPIIAEYFINSNCELTSNETSVYFNPVILIVRALTHSMYSVADAILNRAPITSGVPYICIAIYSRSDRDRVLAYLTERHLGRDRIDEGQLNEIFDIFIRILKLPSLTIRNMSVMTTEIFTHDGIRYAIKIFKELGFDFTTRNGIDSQLLISSNTVPPNEYLRYVRKCMVFIEGAYKAGLIPDDHVILACYTLYKDVESLQYFLTVLKDNRVNFNALEDGTGNNVLHRMLSSKVLHDDMEKYGEHFKSITIINSCIFMIYLYQFGVNLSAEGAHLHSRIFVGRYPADFALYYDLYTHYVLLVALGGNYAHFKIRAWTMDHEIKDAFTDIEYYLKFWKNNFAISDKILRLGRKAKLPQNITTSIMHNYLNIKKPNTSIRGYQTAYIDEKIPSYILYNFPLAAKRLAIMWDERYGYRMR